MASARPKALSHRFTRTALGLAVGLMASLAIAATPALAVVSGGFGVQERSEVAKNQAEPLQYHGGPVLHSTDTYAIYWDPTGSYRGDWERLIDGFFQNLGTASATTENVFALDSQYTDSTGRAEYQSTFRGAYTTADPYPTTGNCVAASTVTCLTDAQIQAELQKVIASGALPGATGTPVYYLLTPPGVTVCTEQSGGECSVSNAPEGSPPNGICGYHSAIDPTGPDPIVYAVQPWVAGNAGEILQEEPLLTASPTAEVRACSSNADLLEEPNQLQTVNPFGGYEQGLADIIINDLSIEQNDVVTDPLLNGWYQTATSAEQSDMCQWEFGPVPNPLPEENEATHAAALSDQSIAGGTYYLQLGFDSEGAASGTSANCLPDVVLEPHFTAPNPINAGDVVAFDASESNISLAVTPKVVSPEEPFTVPNYDWEFGDGTVVSGPEDSSVFHSYKYGGAYQVTLTVTDSAGHKASYDEAVTVDGPPPPGGTAGTGGGTGAAPGSPNGLGQTATSPPLTGTTPTGSTPVSPPVISAKSLSTSLGSSLKRGLPVRYSVSERVAGRFELLLARPLAKRLKLKGPAATGLPRGAQPSIVIARSVLVTTKGGRGQTRIKLSKRDRSVLRKLHKVKLTLRMVAHGASPGSATSTSSSQVVLRS